MGLQCMLAILTQPCPPLAPLPIILNHMYVWMNTDQQSGIHKELQRLLVWGKQQLLVQFVICPSPKDAFISVTCMTMEFAPIPGEVQELRGGENGQRIKHNLST